MEFTRAVPSGRATTVVEPLSSTVAPYRSASSRACRSRAAATWSAVTPAPSNRAASPACGVSRVGAVRPASSRGPRRASSVRPSASTSTGTSLASASSSASAVSSPEPGPTTQDCTRPVVSSTSGWRRTTSSAGRPW